MFEDRSEGEAIMKTWIVVILVVFLVLFVAVATAPGFEKSLSPADVPKCDPATEATHKGTVGRVEDYMRPASGGMGRGLLSFWWPTCGGCSCLFQTSLLGFRNSAEAAH